MSYRKIVFSTRKTMDIRSLKSLLFEIQRVQNQLSALQNFLTYAQQRTVQLDDNLCFLIDRILLLGKDMLEKVERACDEDDDIINMLR